MLKTTHTIVREKKKNHCIFLGKQKEVPLAKANALQKRMQPDRPCHLTQLNTKRSPALVGPPAIEELVSAASGLTHNCWGMQSAPLALQQLVAGAFKALYLWLARHSGLSLLSSLQGANELSTLALKPLGFSMWALQRTRRPCSKGCTKSNLVWTRNQLWKSQLLFLTAHYCCQPCLCPIRPLSQ